VRFTTSILGVGLLVVLGFWVWKVAQGFLMVSIGARLDSCENSEKGASAGDVSQGMGPSIAFEAKRL
jgi:hypothetical protein